MKSYNQFINESVRDMMTPKSEEEIEKYLFDGIDAKKLTPDKKLRLGSRIGVYQLVKQAIDDGANVHTYGDDPIRTSSSNGHIDVVRILIEAGADIHSRDDYALQHSCEQGHIDVVKLLLDSGADIHTKDDAPLKWACRYGRVDVVKLLLEWGANVYANDNEPLKLALDNQEGCQMLVDEGFTNDFNTDSLNRANDVIKLLKQQMKK